MTTIEDIMHGIITIDKNLLISEAAARMDKNKRGSIIVTENGKPVGIFTERDILRLVAQGQGIKGSKLLRFYTKNIITAEDSTSLEEASKIMARNSIRRLPVTKNGKIVGIVTANTIAKNMRFSIAEKLVGTRLTSQSLRP